MNPFYDIEIFPFELKEMKKRETELVMFLSSDKKRLYYILKLYGM